MGNFWIRFGCFLTGYNYDIVTRSSEAASKAVKRYTAAMMIIGILWSFIGYTFTQRYLDGGLWGSVAGAIVLLVIIIQIERQIILSIQPNKLLYVFRGVIALMMSIIGAIIIDQIIFKDDIDLKKMSIVEERVNKALPSETDELNRQSRQYDSLIRAKDSVKQQMLADIKRSPTVPSITRRSETTYQKVDTFDAQGNRKIISVPQTKTSVEVNQIPNPLIDQLPSVDSTLSQLMTQKGALGDSLLQIRPRLKNEIESKVGFLDELEVMHKLIMGSDVAMIVWLIWFFFLVGLEMLVLVSKVNDRKNDYDETVIHQMNHHLRKLRLLSESAIRN